MYKNILNVMSNGLKSKCANRILGFMINLCLYILALIFLIIACLSYDSSYGIGAFLLSIGAVALSRLEY